MKTCRIEIQTIHNNLQDKTSYIAYLFCGKKYICQSAPKTTEKEALSAFVQPKIVNTWID